MLHWPTKSYLFGLVANKFIVMLQYFGKHTIMLCNGCYESVHETEAIEDWYII